MSKKFTTGATLLLLLSLLAGSLVFAQQGAATLADNNTDALKATDEILQIVSKLRQLEIKQPVKRGAKTRDEIKASIIHDLDDSNTPAEFEATAKTLKKFGLLPSQFQLRDYTIRLLTEQVAGFYDPKTEFFYLASWIPLAEQKTVIAHELTHALQDQHFNLKRFDKWPKGDSDAETAAHAIAEGEATIVMFQYDFGEKGIPFDVTRLPSLTELLLAEGVDNDEKKFPVLSNAPTVLKEGLQFPYFYGAGFVQALLKKGGWSRVNEAYATLPASTEQVMHPDKFLAKELPVKVELADLTATLGRDWQRIDTDINGEFGFQLLLGEFIDKAKARTAAAGWGGDHYATYENKTSNAVLVAQFTNWDSLKDAEEFFNAYSERTEKRYNSKSASFSNATSRVYQTSEGWVILEWRDKDVVILEGAYSREQLQRLSQQFWKSKKSAA
ncbi:MAG: hypothetical protein HY231_16310 [Acidobacteria bacterium]|nr:hypothetical protein [Acidobacteriota bacterium]